MSKFLLIGSVAAMLYGDCVFAMDGIDPWAGVPSQNSRDSQENAPASNSDQFSAEPARGDASPNIRSRRNSQENVRTFYQNQQTQTEQTRANPEQFGENRFIRNSSGYRQYHYDLSDNALVGQATPTTIVGGDLKGWSNISEIRYANDVSYDKLENPKVIFYRNKDNSCYIILRIKDTKYDVFYGLNERNIEVGRSSFAVYEMSDDVGSFTDGVPRRIYVDESGLYFVPIEGNSIKDVIKTYQNEGKFNFKGSVIKVSAIDGTITWNGEPVTEDNFFDNWVLEKNKTVLSTKQSGEKEVLRNFYPPNGRYNGIYFQKVKNERGEYRTESINSYREGISWLNSFVNKRLSQTKATNENGAEELVRDGTFASILSLPNERFISFSSKFGSDPGYYQKVCDAVATQVVAAKQTQTGRAGTFVFGASSSTTSQSIPGMILQNPTLFKNPDFVRKLKPVFEGVEKDYEESRIAGSELWLPFEIVRNL